MADTTASTFLNMVSKFQLGSSMLPSVKVTRCWLESRRKTLKNTHRMVRGHFLKISEQMNGGNSEEWVQNRTKRFANVLLLQELFILVAGEDFDLDIGVFVKD